MATKVSRAQALARGQLGSVPLDGMRDQAKNREFAVWYDQHRDSSYLNAEGKHIFEDGRPYWSTVEKSTKMPVGPVYRAGWVAPWEAPQSYIVTSIGKITKGHIFDGSMPKGMTTDRFRIDYQQMATDDRQSYQQYYNHAVRVASDRNLDIPRYGSRFDFRLVAIIGPSPRDPRIAEAAMAGNKWLLGQLMPVYNPKTQRTEVIEDEQLARLLKQGDSDLITAEEAERAAEREERSVGPVPDQVQELMAEMKAMKRELEAMRAEKAAKRGPGRPPSKKDETPAGV